MIPPVCESSASTATPSPLIPTAEKPLTPAIDQRRSPLAASLRYYPGFFGALFLILLRTAIGWHFYHEGDLKLHSADRGGANFSAEGYLRNATGPLAPKFRALIPDPHGLKKLDEATLTASWRDELNVVRQHYGFSRTQSAEAETALNSTQKTAHDWFSDGERIHKLRLYREDIDRLAKLEKEPPAVTFEQERVEAARKKLDTERRELVATIDAWSGALRDSWIKLARPEQVQQAGAIASHSSSLDRVNLQTTYGLLIIGGCLMLGLFTPVAALAAAGFLAMIYLSMPPWPGLPEGAAVEGHYLYVNKNLVEMLACLVLASTPNGLWLGLDALLFGWIGRGRRNAQDAETFTPTTTVTIPHARDRNPGAPRR